MRRGRVGGKIAPNVVFIDTNIHPGGRKKVSGESSNQIFALEMRNSANNDDDRGRRPSAVLRSAMLFAWGVFVLSPRVAAAVVPNSNLAGAYGVGVGSKSLGSFQLLPTAAELELTLRLLYASVAGAVIGFERSTSDRPAGIRTMSLVSLGAAVFTLCSIYGFMGDYDTSRMASNVASGVGFIGAGVITNNRKQNSSYEQGSSVKGLTTAAAIWVSAAVGVSAGSGMYFLSMFASIR